ncbi:hypothetical protein GRAN_1077 [Granulicella sibirica]|uniref:Uncharacterized protein n=1 Tax=Granulicella sibirica TaxID=2479048 RepID=A0A4Q0T3C5_9BACT|nr:hypothetical protein GRAN_1077 [Granulicella sibirica]
MRAGEKIMNICVFCNGRMLFVPVAPSVATMLFQNGTYQPGGGAQFEAVLPFVTDSYRPWRASIRRG